MQCHKTKQYFIDNERWKVIKETFLKSFKKVMKIVYALTARQTEAGHIYGQMDREEVVI